MEGELSFDNILGADEIDNLFVDEEEGITKPTTTESGEQVDEKSKDDNKEKDKETTEVDVNTLFTDPESVGSGKEDNKEKEDTDIDKGNSSSPKNFYYSIAKALKDEGIFPDLANEAYDKITKPEDFRDLVEQQIQAGLDERQKRIDEALRVGIEPTEINKYESTINYLNSIKDEAVSEEGEKGETLRKQLIYQDFINRGYSQERASREVQKSLNAGTDVDDAIEALTGNREFFTSKYDNLIKSAKEEEADRIKDRDKQNETLKKSILEDKKVFGEVDLDKATRQKVYDSISKPVFKDEDGNYLTAVQKYERDNSTEFLKNIGIIFTLTDGFKNLDGLVRGKVSKEVKKGLKELENTLNNTTRTLDGSLNYSSGVNDDPESFFKKNWDVDI